MADHGAPRADIVKARVSRKLHVKAYWLSESGNVNATAELKTGPQEIRYLSFADPLCLNYAELHSGLIQTFMISPHNSYVSCCKLQLFWKDVEGDFVSFSSDTELSEAIAMGMRKDVLHLYFQKIN